MSKEKEITFMEHHFALRIKRLKKLKSKPLITNITVHGRKDELWVKVNYRAVS